MLKKFSIIFEKKEKIKFLFLILLMIFGTVIEILGIGLIVPIIFLFLKGTDGITQIIFLNYFIPFFNSFEKNNIFLIILIFLLIVYFIKYLILTFLYFFQQNFTSDILIRISNSIFKNYLSRPYIFFLKNNSSRLINNLIRQSEIFVTQGLEPILLILSESIFFIGIVLFLIFFEPYIVFFTLFSILLPTFFFYLLIKNRARSWGYFLQRHNEEVIKNLQQTIHGIKEIKIFNKQNDFLNSFNFSFSAAAKTRRNMQFFNQLPRIWLELITILVIGIYVYFLLKIKTGAEVVTLLALFSVAVFRLLPSLNRIILAFQNLRYGLAAIDTVYFELKNNNIDKHEILYEEKFDILNEINFVNVSFAYNNTKVLNKINLNILKGQSVGVVGKTGVGKSTFINLFTGLLVPTAGEIIINNKINLHNSINQVQDWQNRIGYVPQAYNLLDDSIEKNITFEDDSLNIDFEWFRYCLSVAEIKDFIDQLPEKSKTKIGERGANISGGQKQRIVIARALYKKPEILILDEATSALDQLTENKIINNILNLSKKITLIFISHKDTILKNFDIIYEIKNNQIINREK